MLSSSIISALLGLSVWAVELPTEPVILVGDENRFFATLTPGLNGEKDRVTLNDEWFMLDRDEYKIEYLTKSSEISCYYYDDEDEVLVIRIPTGGLEL